MTMNKKGMLLVGLLSLLGCSSVEPGQVGVEICMSEMQPGVLASQRIEATRAVLNSNQTRTVFVPNGQLFFNAGAAQ